MKIAYYEENDYHTEIMGTFITKFIDCSFTVYNTNDKSKWIQYYKTIYGFDIKPSESLLNEYENYDKIIIGTSSSCSNLLVSVKDNIDNKLLYICHLNGELELFPQTKTIVLTPLNKTPCNHYLLPINDFYTNIYPKSENIFGIVGRFKNNNRNYKEIINIIKKYSHIPFCFHIFARNSKSVPQDFIELNKIYPKHIKISFRVETVTLVKYFSKIKYLCQFNDDDSVYCKDRLTGVIPLSYNFNIPLILNKKLADIYNINSGFTYDTSIDEIFENILKQPILSYNEKLNILSKEKNQIIENNNKILFNLYN